MRAGTAVSVTAHALLIVLGIWSIAPKALDASKSEAIPVTMVKIDAVTASPKVAPQPAAAPKPQLAPPVTPPPPKPAAETAPPPKPIAEAAPPPKPTPAPAPKPAPAPAVAKVDPAPPAPAAKPAPVTPPATTVAAATPSPPPPKPRVAPPTPAPTPAAAAPKPAKPAPEEPFDIDKITQVLDRPAAKPSPPPQPAQPPREPEAQPDALALGSLIAASAVDAHMTMSELDALRARIAQCWTPPPGWVDPGEVRVVMIIALNADGSVKGSPEVVQGPAGRYAQAAPESAVRAVRACAPYTLPAAKYEDWKEVKITFDPRAMATG